MGKVVKQTDRGKQEVRGFIPGQDNDEIVKTLVAITEQGETHAKVKRKKMAAYVSAQSVRKW